MNKKQDRIFCKAVFRSFLGKVRMIKILILSINNWLRHTLIDVKIFIANLQ